MRNIIINHQFEHIHLNLGISDERVEELESEVQDLIKNTVSKKIIQSNEDSVTLSGSVLLHELINNIAKTHEEQILLTLQFTSLIDYLDSRLKEFIS